MAPYYNDDRTEINPELVPMPSLCLVCKKKDDPYEEILCNLNRMGRDEDEEFKCYDFEEIDK